MCTFFFLKKKKKKKNCVAGLGFALNKLLVPNSINNQVSSEYLCFSWAHIKFNYHWYYHPRWHLNFLYFDTSNVDCTFYFFFFFFPSDFLVFRLASTMNFCFWSIPSIMMSLISLSSFLMLIEIVRLNLINHFIGFIPCQFACNSTFRNLIFRWESCKGSVWRKAQKCATQ